jgi:hypothetical protein
MKLPASSAPRPPLGSGGAYPRKEPISSQAQSSRVTTRVEFSGGLDRIEAQIQAFRVEYERFLSGDRPRPPEDQRIEIQGLLRTARNAVPNAIAENFRLGAVEAQFNAYNELFTRRQRLKEEGPMTGRPARHHEAPRPDLRAGVEIDRSLSAEAVATLYTGLYPDSGRVDLGAFREYLRKQVESIRQRTGCETIVFRIATVDGKQKLKARPVQTPPSP